MEHSTYTATTVIIVRKHSIATPPAPLGHNWATDAMRTGRGGRFARSGREHGPRSDRGRYVNILPEVRPKRHAFLFLDPS
jgi:hypothetical protein